MELIGTINVCITVFHTNAKLETATKSYLEFNIISKIIEIGVIVSFIQQLDLFHLF